MDYISNIISSTNLEIVANMPVTDRLRVDEIEKRIKKVEGNKFLVIHNPHHTICTVANVLDIDLTRNQRKNAGLLVFKKFKYIHANNEPAHSALFDVNHYSNDDFWIVRIAVKRGFEGAVHSVTVLVLLKKQC
jgi:hypothetical protein